MHQMPQSHRRIRMAWRLSRAAAPWQGMRRLAVGLICLAAAAAADAAGHGARVHGLWVWQGPALLKTPEAREQLRDFCSASGINEVYVSVLSQGRIADAEALSALVGQLHESHVRVEALLSSTDADEPGAHRDTFLDHVGAVVKFNQQHPRSRLDGLHLDVEPQQRPENKGSGNLRFVAGLLETFRGVRALAEPAGLTVNADIQQKLLKAPLADRRALLQSLPRLTLMLYEVSSASEGSSAEAKAQKLRTVSHAYLETAYADLEQRDLAIMIIGLRTADYGVLLPQMLGTLDDANGSNPHYGGWARHSYNDTLRRPP